MVTNSLNFPSVDNVLISPLFLKVICTGYEMFRLAVLFFQHLKNDMPLLLSMISDKSVVIQIVVPLQVRSFFSHYIQDFLLLLFFALEVWLYVLMWVSIGLYFFMVHLASYVDLALLSNGEVSAITFADPKWHKY